MSVLSATFDYLRLQDNEVAWKLLRAKNAPVVLAILDAHLGGSDRKLTVPELESLVAVDLDELRLRTDLLLVRSAKEYCDGWREDGYLIRRPMVQTRQETYELSSGALAAITFARQLVQPRRTATQSRLANIVSHINDLADAIDEDEENRKNALLEERERIDAQLKELEAGRLNIIDSEQALEQLQEIISLALEIPHDFVRVRDDFEHINNTLYSTIINYSEGHREVLEDIFDGVDQISQSPSGRSFKGFYSLLRDSELTELVQDDIDEILEKDFSKELSVSDRQFLRNLLREFREQSQEVNTALTSFAQGLRRFVQNQDYLQDRVLKQLIDTTLGKASTLKEAIPVNQKLSITLDLTTVKLQSVARYTLANPFETRAEEVASIEYEEFESLTLEELRELTRQTEIDFTELAANVNESLRKARQIDDESLSIGQILAAHPATQGVASVVGLVFLAMEQGRQTEETEEVSWFTKQEEQRFARIKRLEFYREVHV